MGNARENTARKFVPVVNTFKECSDHVRGMHPQGVEQTDVWFVWGIFRNWDTIFITENVLAFIKSVKDEAEERHKAMEADTDTFVLALQIDTESTSSLRKCIESVTSNENLATLQRAYVQMHHQYRGVAKEL
jgi:hypothetical protein